MKTTRITFGILFTLAAYLIAGCEKENNEVALT